MKEDIKKKGSKIYNKKLFFHIQEKVHNKVVHNLQIISIKNIKLKDFSIISKACYLIQYLQIKINHLMI